MVIEATVTAAKPKATFVFSCIPHLTHNSNEHQIERWFYTRYSQNRSVPEGEHYEIEIINRPRRSNKTIQLSTYRNLKGKEYIRIATRIPDFETAKGLFRVWCVMMTYILSYHRQFDISSKSDPDEIITRIEREHGIKIKSVIER